MAKQKPKTATWWLYRSTFDKGYCLRKTWPGAVLLDLCAGDLHRTWPAAKLRPDERATIKITWLKNGGLSLGPPKVVEER